MIGLCFIVSLASAASDPLKTYLLGNWTSEVIKVRASLSEKPEKQFFIRITEKEADQLSVALYGTNVSTNVIDSYIFTVSPPQFGRTADELQPITVQSGDSGSKLVTGRWDDYIYNFVLSSPTKANLQLVNDGTGEFITVNFVKDVDRRPPGFFRKLGMLIIMGVGFIGVQGLQFWMSRRQMGNQQAQRLAAMRVEQKRKQEEAKKDVAKVEEVKEGENEQKVEKGESDGKEKTE
jgi:hypothetical protein